MEIESGKEHLYLSRLEYVSTNDYHFEIHTPHEGEVWYLSWFYKRGAEAQLLCKTTHRTIDEARQTMSALATAFQRIEEYVYES